MLVLCFVFYSCGDNQSSDPESGGGGDIESAGAGNENLPVEDDTEVDLFVSDDLAEFDFGGSAFRIAVQDVSWLYVLYDTQEETGELINDAVYQRNRKIEERFNVELMQEPADVAGIFRRNVQSGTDAFELYLPVDREALVFGTEGMTYKLADIPHIDINKPYWSQSLNSSLTINNDLYFAYGSFNLSVYDYTHLMLFDKQMLADLAFESPYGLVSGGGWTFDVYEQMAKAAVNDLNGDGVMDDNDVYGLVSLDKHVLPCFWAAAGVESISKSSDDIPQFTLIGDEKFASVIDKIFDITQGNDSWYSGRTEITADKAMSGHALFMNCTFKMVGDLRGIDTDFGIIPYPKYNAEQEKYYSRVEGGNPGIVPVTAGNLEMTGVILEVLNAESAKTVIPAYYDISLKTKDTRDEESSKMLDLIFSTRVYDLGDTYWSPILRDGMFLDMFSRNDRNLASHLERIEPRINSELEKVIAALAN